MTGAGLQTRASDWLLFGAGGPRSDARVRLVCFHYAGSGASMFAPWAAALPDAVELLAVQLPGRENRL
ncbi:thioesterase II family protein, partial [Burkholderia glumae]